MTNIKHIIWDWNGTLLNDTWLCVNIMNEFLTEREKPILSLEKYQSIFDFPIRDYYIRAGIDLQEYDFEQISIEFIERYNQNVFACQLYAESISTLAQCKNKGISHSILSAREDTDLQNDMNHYQLFPWFENICGIENIYGHGKKHIANELFRKIGLQSTEILLIGDTTHDFEVAKSLGVNCVLISHGHHSKEKLKATKQTVIHSISELLTLLN